MGLILWDVVTTYFGTLAVFTPDMATSGIIDRVMSAEPFVHIVSVVFAIGLIVFILSYQIIFDAQNKITTAILIVAFIYDFATSFYGTGIAANIDYSNISQVLVTLLLAIMTTASPLLISHILED